MKKYLTLFLTMLKIGFFTFGGGYAMIAVSESTPGPIAVNIATFIGSNQAGILGSFFATLGVVTPSFIIILLIAALITAS